MMRIHGYELRTPRCGRDYFNGGYGQPREWETEFFGTEAEALEARQERMIEVREQMAWAGWWVERYARDEDFTVQEAERVL